MDRIDRAFAKTIRNPRAAAKVRRYGVARYRQHIRRHIMARGMVFVQIDQQEPSFIHAVMTDTVAKWDFDGCRPFRCQALTIREENTLFGHPGRMPSRRQQAEVLP